MADSAECTVVLDYMVEYGPGTESQWRVIDAATCRTVAYIAPSLMPAVLAWTARPGTTVQAIVRGEQVTFLF